jgi:hypothetical protein
MQEKCQGRGTENKPHCAQPLASRTVADALFGRDTADHEPVKSRFFRIASRSVAKDALCLEDVPLRFSWAESSFPAR